MADQNIKQHPSVEWYRTSFERFEQTLNGEASSSLHTIRKNAIAKFIELGFPTTRNEEWKYTDVSLLAKVQFSPILAGAPTSVSKSDIDAFTFGLESHRLVFVNGHFAPSLSSEESLPHGMTAGSLSVALHTDRNRVMRYLSLYADYTADGFTALGTAFITDGACIFVPPNAIVTRPIHIIYVATEAGTDAIYSPRTLVVAGKHSEVKIIESHVSTGANRYLTNAVSEIVLEENAIVEFDTLQMGNDQAFHISTTRVEQERNSNFVSNVITMSGSLVRNNIHAVLDGEGAEATLNGLYLGTGTQHIDNHTTIEHAKPHCPSHELYKGILSGKSRGVFNGKIKVRKDAQKTDAKQTNKNLILSGEASVDTKPQLEIFANDVKCTHGATIGQLDDEAVFYLRSRGVDADKARDILIYAFASDVIDRMKIEPIREQLQAMVHDRLEAGRK